LNRGKRKPDPKKEVEGGEPVPREEGGREEMVQGGPRRQSSRDKNEDLLKMLNEKKEKVGTAGMLCTFVKDAVEKK